MKINGMNFTIGTDPEHFISQDNKWVSAFGRIPGTKDQPHKVNHGAVQIDGMATEFNVDPADSADQLVANIKAVRQQLADMLPGFQFLEQASVKLTNEIFETMPLEALLLGCDPDFNCYTGDINPAPDMMMPMRTAGGHVHVGGFHTNDIYSEEHFTKMGRLISLMDESVGIYSLLWDKDDERRQLYGKAGAFRPKSYGVEWRTPSAMWTFKDDLIKFVFNQTGKAIARFFDADYQPHHDVQSIMNNSDRNHALLQDGEEVRYLKAVMGV